MKTRLTVVILLLVVLPTAFLSVLAGKAIRSREAVLKQGLEMSAANALNALASDSSADLRHTLDHVNHSMTLCLAANGEYRDIDTLAGRLKQDDPLIDEVLVFMNPWGFVYPDIEKAETNGRSRADVLTPVLRGAISARRESNDIIRVTGADGAYCFSQVEGRKDVYAGYRVSTDAFRNKLARHIRGKSVGGFIITAEGPGLTVHPEGVRLPGEVIVTDSLHDETATEPDSDVLRPAFPADKPLAASRLHKPFNYVRLSAYLTDAAAIQSLSRYETRLYIWAVALLAAAVLAGVWLVVRDAVTEIRQARSQSEFVIGVSHDLRTPLASMRMLAESLHAEHVTEPAKRRKFLETIMTESERMGLLIERVLFFIRFGQDALVFRPLVVNAEELVKRTVKSFGATKQNEAAGTGIELRTETGLPGVKVDETALGQVVLNLLDNAWKYGRTVKGEKIEVEIAAWHGRRGFLSFPRDWVRISVIDHGVGIHKKHLRKLFNKYYRVPETAAMNVSGVGLGLALCRRIVVAHGGYMEVRSEYGKGSTFSINLPAGKETE